MLIVKLVWNLTSIFMEFTKDYRLVQAAWKFCGMLIDVFLKVFDYMEVNLIPACG
jgi:hypothetical protein